MEDTEFLFVANNSESSDSGKKDKLRSSYDLIQTISKDLEVRIRQLHAICAPNIAIEDDVEENRETFFEWLTLEYKKRKKRADFFRSDIFFGEPAWDMLLDLAIQRCLRKNISVTSACIASSAPMTTALRWVSVLESEGLADRKQDPVDKRRYFLVITDAGFEKLHSYYLAI